jgi:hypothetical protein
MTTFMDFTGLYPQLIVPRTWNRKEMSKYIIKNNDTILTDEEFITIMIQINHGLAHGYNISFKLRGTPKV